MTSEIPAANTNVSAISARRDAKLEAKEAGNMTEMQQGAKSATIPARSDASTLPPKRAVVICDVGRRGRLRASEDCNYEPVVIDWPGGVRRPKTHRSSIYYSSVAAN